MVREIHKCEAWSLGSQDPHEARHGGPHHSSIPTVSWEEGLRLIPRGPECQAGARPASNKMDGEDSHTRLSSDRHRPVSTLTPKHSRT